MTYRCINIDEDFIIDGNIGKYSNMIGLLDNFTGKMPLQATKFALIRSKDYLYCIFAVQDNCITENRTGYNSKLYEGEVVEIFFATGNRNRYIELEVSPQNTRYCAKVKCNKKAKSIKLLEKCCFTSIVTGMPDGYVTEMKINIKAAENALSTKLPIEYFNAYRIDRPKDKVWELSAGNPTGKATFHIKESFIKIVNVREAKR